MLVFDDLRLVYRGQFVNDMKEGFGTISSDPSQIPNELRDVRKEIEEGYAGADPIVKKSIYHFEGNFHRDRKEGDGQLYAKGIWVSKLGKNSMLGAQSFISGASNGEDDQHIKSEKYSGIFSNDMFHGKGIYIDSYGKMHEGIFEHGKMQFEKLQSHDSESNT